MKLSTTSKSEALGNCNFPQIYSLGWFEATSTPTSLNTLSTFMIHEIRRPQKNGWKSRNAYQNLWLGAQTSSYLYTWSYHTIILMILVCCISSYICRLPLPVIIQPLLWVATSINVLDMERNHGNFRECELSIECWWVNGYNHHVFCPTAQRDAKVP